MSLYDAAKDAVKLAQKADNAELVQKLLDVQQQALDMQEKQSSLNKKIDELNREILQLKERKKYKYEDGHSWMINPENPSLKLCPTCFNRDGFENPMGSYGTKGGYCHTCKRAAY